MSFIDLLAEQIGQIPTESIGDAETYANILYDYLSTSIIYTDNWWQFDFTKLLWQKNHKGKINTHIKWFISNRLNIILPSNDKIDLFISRLNVVSFQTIVRTQLLKKLSVPKSLNFNSIDHLFPLANGEVCDLRTGEVFPRSSSDMFTFESPVKYNPDAQSDALDKYLKHISDDDESYLQMLQSILGMCLMGKTLNKKYKKVFVFEGFNNGKFILLHMMCKIMGDFVAGKPEDDDVTPKEMTRLRIIRASHSKILATKISDMLTNNHGYKLIVTSDHPIKFFNHTEKIQVISFSRVVTCQPMKELHVLNVLMKKFTEEEETLSAFFNWLLKGAMSASNY